MHDWGYVYVIQMQEHPWLKIGSTQRDHANAVQERLVSMQTGCPLLLHVRQEYYCKFPRTVEGFVHQILGEYRRQGEWFETTLDAIDDTVQSVITHLDDPTFFMTPAQQARYTRWQASQALGDAIMDRRPQREIDRLAWKYDQLKNKR
jgi:Meiotically up-regulated gene 113